MGVQCQSGQLVVVGFSDEFECSNSPAYSCIPCLFKVKFLDVFVFACCTDDLNKGMMENRFVALLRKLTRWLMGTGSAKNGEYARTISVRCRDLPL